MQAAALLTLCCLAVPPSPRRPQLKKRIAELEAAQEKVGRHPAASAPAVLGPARMAAALNITGPRPPLAACLQLSSAQAAGQAALAQDKAALEARLAQAAADADAEQRKAAAGEKAAAASLAAAEQAAKEAREQADQARGTSGCNEWGGRA